MTFSFITYLKLTYEIRIPLNNRVNHCLDYVIYQIVIRTGKIGASLVDCPDVLVVSLLRAYLLSLYAGRMGGELIIVQKLEPNSTEVV